MKQSVDLLFWIGLLLFTTDSLDLSGQVLDDFNPPIDHLPVYAYSLPKISTSGQMLEIKGLNVESDPANLNRKRIKWVLAGAQIAVGAATAALTAREVKEYWRLKQVEKYGPYRHINSDLLTQRLRANLFFGGGMILFVPLHVVRRRL